MQGWPKRGWACLSPCSSAWLPKYDSTLVIWAEQAEWAGWAVKQCKKICSSAIGIVLLPSLPAQPIQPRSLVCCQIWVTGQMSKVIATFALSWAYLILLLLIYLVNNKCNQSGSNLPIRCDPLGPACHIHDICLCLSAMPSSLPMSAGE